MELATPAIGQIDAQDRAWTHGPVPLARGRAAKDPLVQTTAYHATSLEEFESLLAGYLKDPPHPPERSECVISFWIGASFMVQPPQAQSQASVQQPPVDTQGFQPAGNTLDAHYAAAASAANAANAANSANAANASNQKQQAQDSPASPSQPPQKIAMSVMQALMANPDPKERMRKQRAIAKVIVESIQKVDGYRYSFHNNWNSREDDAYRFSYYCNDSLLNKDRAANGKGAKVGKRSCKPVYDCRGVLSVKFSATKSSLDVVYKHIPVHKTYEERAPLPRRDSKRRRWLEEHDPDALQRKRKEPFIEEIRIGGPFEQKPKKKKIPYVPMPKTRAVSSIESDLRAQSLQSLLELIRTDPNPQTARKEDKAAQNRRRQRNGCDTCRAKRNRCDELRPTCTQCINKQRVCVYGDPSDNAPTRSRGPGVNVNASPAQLSDQRPVNFPATSSPAKDGNSDQLSELEKLKKELEDAKRKIAELETEKAAASKQQQQEQQQPPPPAPQNQSSPVNQLQTAQAAAAAVALQDPGVPVYGPLSAGNTLARTESPYDRAQASASPWSINGYYGYAPATQMPPSRPDQWGPASTGSSTPGRPGAAGYR